MMRLLPALLLAFGLLAGPPLSPTAAAEPENAAIEAVIADQIAAFQRDDFAAAFAHAAPGIQAKFGSPEGFGKMVRQGYPMIHRPARVEWGALRPDSRGGLVKTVLFEDARGQLFEADYFMGVTGSAWRIQGVQLRKLPGVSS